MFKVGILTASDKGSKGQREDLSARVIEEMVTNAGWKVEEYHLVPDELEVIKNVLISMVEERKLDLILTTGGTGFSPRDVTPEATKAVIHREAPGIPEVMRAVSFKKTSRAMLSRATAGIRKKTLIVNLPGSPKAVRECLEAIMDSLPHGLETMTGKAGECGTHGL